MIEPTRTIIQGEQLYFGEQEFTNLMRVLIKVYRYKNRNQNPKAIVIPIVFEVDGVKIEFPRKEIPHVRKTKDTGSG